MSLQGLLSVSITGFESTSRLGAALSSEFSVGEAGARLVHGFADSPSHEALGDAFVRKVPGPGAVLYKANALEYLCASMVQLVCAGVGLARRSRASPSSSAPFPTRRRRWRR